jgi:foldase protein PrsA
MRATDFRPVLLCLLLGATLAGQRPETGGSRASPLAFETRVAAFVNRDVITEYEVWKELRGAAAGTTGERREQLFREKLQDLIRSRIYNQASERIQLVINPETITAVIEEQKEAAGGTEAFAQTLRDRGTNLDEYQENLARSYRRSVIERVRAGEIKGLGDVLRAEHVIEPTVDEIRRHYAINRERQFRIGPSVKLQKMFFSRSQYQASPTETEEVAQRIRGELETGGDWGVLAKQFSSDPSDRETGGELGWVRIEESELAREILDYAARGETGAISPPIAAPRGHFLVRVLERRDARIVPFEECQGLIRQILREEKIRRARVEVELNLLRDAYIQPAELKAALQARLSRELGPVR